MQLGRFELPRAAGPAAERPAVKRRSVTFFSRLVVSVVLGGSLLACTSNTADPVDLSGPPKTLTEQKSEALLLLDSFDSTQSMLALIQLRRADQFCAVCTLESHIESERRALRHLLERGLPPVATEQAQSKLKLLNQYRERAPFDESACPLPCNTVD